MWAKVKVRQSLLGVGGGSPHCLSSSGQTGPSPTHRGSAVCLSGVSEPLPCHISFSDSCCCRPRLGTLVRTLGSPDNPGHPLPQEPYLNPSCEVPTRSRFRDMDAFRAKVPPPRGPTHPLPGRLRGSDSATGQKGLLTIGDEGRGGGHPKGPHGGPASPDEVSRRRAGAGRPGCSGGETGFPAWGAFRSGGGSEWREGRQELGVETVNRPLAGSGVSGQWAQEGSGVCGFGVGGPWGPQRGRPGTQALGTCRLRGEPAVERRERRVLVGQGSTFPGSWGFADSRHLLPGAECQPTRRAQGGACPRARACVRAAGRRLSLRALSLLRAPLPCEGSGARGDRLLSWPSENFLSGN